MELEKAIVKANSILDEFIKDHRHSNDLILVASDIKHRLNIGTGLSLEQSYWGREWMLKDWGFIDMVEGAICHDQDSEYELSCLIDW